MAPLFISTYTNKIDQKGRVSVPAPFRDVLGVQTEAGLYVYPSFKHNALEGCSQDWIANMGGRIAQLDEFSDERDILVSILGQAHRLPMDTEGRIVLPGKLTGMIGITDQVAFVGTGNSFQLWAPDALNAHEAAMRKMFLERKMTLPAAIKPEIRPS